MYTRKSLLNFKFSWTQSKSRFFELFFLTKCRRKTKSRFEEKLSPGVLDLVSFFQKNNFSFFEKMLWGSGAIFLRLLVRTEENKSVKEFVCFSTTDVFVPVSQLSTRDLFYFLDNLKIKQDMFVLSFSRLVRSLDQRALWFPYSRFFGTKMFKKMLILECLGCFTKSIVVSILDFWHISFRKMFEWMTCKRNHNFESRASCKTIKIVIMACGSFNFFSFRCLKRKARIELVAM